MKTMTLAVLLAVGGSLLITSRADAAACPKEIYRQVQSLDHLTDRLLSEYRNELRTFSKSRSVSWEQEALMDTFYEMEHQADDLRSAVENRESPCTQERLFSSLQQSHCRAESLARRVGVCGCVKGLMAQTSSAINALDRMGFQIAPPPPPRYERPQHPYGHGHDSGHRSSRPPHPRDVIIGGLLGILGSR
jgi:hypothetical protein